MELGEIQNSTRISVWDPIQCKINNHFDDITKRAFILDDDDITDYVNDYLRKYAIDWVMSKIDEYDPNRGSLDNYIQLILKHYMISKHWKIRKDVEFRDLVLKPYYREKKLNQII